MGISAIDSIGEAFGRMTRMLFKPFDFSKWLVIGFALFSAAVRQRVQPAV